MTEKEYRDTLSNGNKIAERQKIIATALKIKEHATRGDGKEKASADEMLKKFIKKHNITEAELGGAKTKLSTEDFEIILKSTFGNELGTIIHIAASLFLPTLFPIRKKE